MSDAVAHPTGAVDCHAHCYDLSQQDFSETAGFHVQLNELGSVEDYAAVLDAHGITHAVLVNPLGGYGTDNRYLLRAVAAGNGRFRGIALLAEDADNRTIASLAEGGIAGIRFNLNFPSSPSLYGAAGQRALAIAREHGWLLQVHYAGDALVEALPVLRASGRTIVIDHCGRPDLDGGLDQPGFAQLLDLGREGSAHVKLSAFFRMGAPRSKWLEYAHALVAAFSVERCLWGSDWPFVRATRRVDYGPQLAFLEAILPDPAERRQVLWDNPARLFGFSGNSA